MHNPDICEGCFKLHSQCECEKQAAYWRERMRALEDAHAAKQNQPAPKEQETKGAK